MKFYVYTLTDPRTNAVFYVGKGQGNRMYAHEYDARKGKRSRKCAVIREILSEGHRLRYAKVSRHSDELDAYQAEATLIEEIGLENLTNVIPGGPGPPSAPPKPFYRAEIFKRLQRGLARSWAVLVSPKYDGKLYWPDGTDVTDTYLKILGGFVDALGEPFVQNAFKEEYEKSRT